MLKNFEIKEARFLILVVAQADTLEVGFLFNYFVNNLRMTSMLLKNKK